MTKYIATAEAIDILKARGIIIGYTLFRHYCNTGRAPKGAIHMAGKWLFKPAGLVTWKPEKRKQGRRRKS